MPVVASNHETNGFARRWIMASGLGWLLGVFVVAVLAMAIEAFAGGVQIVVGLGMGAGIGFLQGRVLAKWIGSQWPWMWASVIGMGIPFLLQDLVRAFGATLPSDLWIYVPLGSLLVASIQRKLLSRVSFASSGWLLPCIIGWSLPLAVIGVGDAIRSAGAIGGVLSLVGIFFGGVLYCAITGRSMEAILRKASV